MDVDEYANVTARFVYHLRLVHVPATKPRKALFLLLYWNGPCDIKRLLSDPYLSLSSSALYRNLEVFVEIGVAQMPAPGLYEISDRFRQHGHSRVCRVCGRRDPFYDARLEKALERMDLRNGPNGFAVEDHTVEFKGVCSQCRQRVEVHVRQPIGGKIRRPPGL